MITGISFKMLHKRKGRREGGREGEEGRNRGNTCGKILVIVETGCGVHRVPCAVFSASVYVWKFHEKRTHTQQLNNKHTYTKGRSDLRGWPGSYLLVPAHSLLGASAGEGGGGLAGRPAPASAPGPPLSRNTDSRVTPVPPCGPDKGLTAPLGAQDRSRSCEPAHENLVTATHRLSVINRASG